MNKSTLFRFGTENKETKYQTEKFQKEKIFNRRSQRLSFFAKREKLSRKIQPQEKPPLPKLVTQRQPAQNVR